MARNVQEENIYEKKTKVIRKKQALLQYMTCIRNDCALLCCKLRRRRLDHERSVGETRFLSALQQNKHSQGFSICFIISNPLNSPLITFNFQNKLFFQSEQQFVGISILS